MTHLQIIDHVSIDTNTGVHMSVVPKLKLNLDRAERGCWLVDLKHVITLHSTIAQSMVMLHNMLVNLLTLLWALDSKICLLR